uniref:DUF834 domain-containing protein n=1 Tax=Oryza nivara TaxID=4536 RepID=A0A0E0FG36_ORYNI
MTNRPIGLGGAEALSGGGDLGGRRAPLGKEVDEPEVGWEDGVAVSTTLTGILGGGGRRRRRRRERDDGGKNSRRGDQRLVD